MKMPFYLLIFSPLKVVSGAFRWAMVFGFFVAVAEAEIADLGEAMSEKSLGSKEAPVVLEEYASLTCHHCAVFHREVLPKLKEQYIDTGKLRYVYRDFPLDIYALRASQLARCVGNDEFFPFLEVLYANQRKWTTSSDPLKSLLLLARQSGMSGENFRQCVGHEGLEKALLKERLQYEKKWKIAATPTLVINDEKFEKGYSFEEVSKAIEAELRN